MLVFLTGFMCSGKTTDGKELAKKLKVPFLDLDTELEKRSRMSIWRYIEYNGERDFRRLESEILRQSHKIFYKEIDDFPFHIQKPEAVIATGGGSILKKKNRKFLNLPGHSVIWLDLPFPLLLERIRANYRPLLYGLTDVEIHRIYLKRLPLYQSTCTHRVSALPFPDQILNLFRLPS